MATLRLARPADAEQLAAIYAPMVRETVISFESDPPGAAEMARRVEATLATHPWLVAERDGVILGYAYASHHRTRSAYRWAVDVTAYVHADARRQGVARRLYAALLALLALQGYYTAFAGITLPNAASVGLHEALGFEPLGIYRTVGFKFGAWHDVGWWQRTLREGDGIPEEPKVPAKLSDDPAFRAALERA
jgi:phosphinothricin acetyltransferase